LPTDIAQVFVGLGDKEKAIEWCRKGIEEHDPGIPYAALILEKLGDDPQIREILKDADVPY